MLTRLRFELRTSSVSYQSISGFLTPDIDVLLTRRNDQLYYPAAFVKTGNQKDTFVITWSSKTSISLKDSQQ